MKIEIEQPNIAALLSRVQNAVEKRNTIPILGNVLLQADGNTLTATGTDLDVQVTTTSEATVHQAGATTVSASMLAAIVGKLGKGKLVTLEADGLSMRIKSGRSDLTLAALPIDDFPQISADGFTAAVDADQPSLARLFDLTAFAMSTEETRYYLNGVHLHTADGNVRAVSTDGHRLAKVDSDIAAEIPGIIIPRKTVTLIRGLLDDGNANVNISETKIRVDLGHTVVTSKLIDGAFPDYTRIIPSEHNTEVRVSASDVKQAAALVSLVSGEKTKAVRVTVGGDALVLEVRSGAEVGLEEVDYEWSGDPVTCGVNSKYLAEILQACNGDDAVLQFKDAGSPIVVRPCEDDGAMFLVMPMRVI